MKKIIKIMILIVVLMTVLCVAFGCGHASETEEEIPVVTEAPEDVEVEAIPTVAPTVAVNTYSITLDFECFQMDEVETAMEGTYFSYDDPTREGYHFRGWYTSAEGGEEIEFPMLVVEDITLYAHWIEKDITDYDEVELLLSLNSAETGYIVTGIANDDMGFFAIPSSVDGIPVVEIADYAFADSNFITKVYIPSSVTKIGSYAFSNCILLEEVILAEGVETIKSNVFDGTYRISEITLPSTIKSISGSTFIGCYSLEVISVASDSVNYISSEGVLFNYDMTELIAYPNGKSSYTYVIPYSVYDVCENAFYNCYNLNKVQIPNNVSYIHESNWIANESIVSFEVGSGNSAFSAVDGVLYSADLTTLVKYPAGLTKAQFIIPSTVTTIASYAFSKSSIEVLVMQTGVTYIQSHAIYDWSGGIIYIPHGVESIESYAFDAVTLIIHVDETEKPESWSTNWTDSNDNGVIFGAW